MKRKINGIARDTLDFILETAKSSMPVEFAALLRAENDVITDVVILPGTESSRMSALIRLYMLPNMEVVGSVHSHPSSNLTPSAHDLALFSRTGDYHIIAGPPFDEHSWTCYNALGERRILPIIDVEFDSEEEFDEGEDF
jgi:proteasome lid subunit RPN8/RPN11